MEKKIYAAINAIQSDLSKIGISKDRKNQQQNYSFRGIDDVYSALAPLLAKYKVCIFPRVTEHKVTERQTAKGGVLFYTTVRVEFDYVSAEDGSTHICVTYGEAMDSADKSTNKAMSAAYKYACLQTFCIPTEGDNDADATTHNVTPHSGSIASDPFKPATNEQIMTLLSLGTDIEALCRYCGVSTAEELSYKQAADAILLKQKR